MSTRSLSRLPLGGCVGCVRARVGRAAVTPPLFRRFVVVPSPCSARGGHAQVGALGGRATLASESEEHRPAHSPAIFTAYGNRRRRKSALPSFASQFSSYSSDYVTKCGDASAWEAFKGKGPVPLAEGEVHVWWVQGDEIRRFAQGDTPPRHTAPHLAPTRMDAPVQAAAGGFQPPPAARQWLGPGPPTGAAPGGPRTECVPRCPPTGPASAARADKERVSALWGTLSAEERDECGAGGGAQARGEEAGAASRVLSKAAARAVLALYTGGDPGALSIVRSPHGKPRLELPGVPRRQRLEYSVTHTGAALGVAVGRGVGVGLDAEGGGRQTSRDPVRLARRRMHPGEARRLEELAAAEGEGAARRMFVALWTAKEAYVKAAARGISAPPGLRSFSVDLPWPLPRAGGGGRIRLSLDEAQGPQLSGGSGGPGDDPYEGRDDGFAHWVGLMEPGEGLLSSLCLRWRRGEGSPSPRLSRAFTFSPGGWVMERPRGGLGILAATGDA